MRRSPVWSPSSCQSEAPALVGIAHLGVRSFPLLAHEQPATGTGLHVARRPHPDIVPERAHLACPIVPLGTRLDADPTGTRSCRKTAARATASDVAELPLPVGINAVRLENRLCYAEPDHHDLSHRSPPVHPSQLTLLPGWRAVQGSGSDLVLQLSSHSPGRPPIGTFVRFSYSLGIYSMRAIASDRLPKLASAKPDSLGSKRPAGGALSGRPSPSSAWPSGPGNSKSLADTLL